LNNCKNTNRLGKVQIDINTVPSVNEVHA